MLLDLSSLRPEIGKGLTLAGIPPGKYNMQIEYPYTGARCDPIRLELLGASDQEKEFINRVLVDPETRLQRSWSDILRQSVVIHDKGLDGLSSTAKGQLRFHLLLSKALTATSASERLKEVLRAQVVPKYLQPEKQVLLLEVAIAGEADGDTQAQMEQLVKAYPDLKWRIDKIKKSGKSFLRYAKLVPGKRGESK